MFRGLLERGDLAGGARFVDIGCGQGLLAALLQACTDLAASGRWPAGWPPPARAGGYHGIELMPRATSSAPAPPPARWRWRRPSNVPTCAPPCCRPASASSSSTRCTTSITQRSRPC
ncbi:MAG: hypothetical protein U1F67_25075 [Rubrivivax sp.]